MSRTRHKKEALKLETSNKSPELFKDWKTKWSTTKSLRTHSCDISADITWQYATRTWTQTSSSQNRDFQFKETKEKWTIFFTLKKNLGYPNLCTNAVVFFSAYLCLVRHFGSCLVPAFRHKAVSPWLQFSNKMAGDSSGEVKQVLLATEAELYIEELKAYPLKEIGSPK